MEKIDRLGWAAGFAFESYGVRVGVRTNDAGAVEQIVARLPHDWKPVETQGAPTVKRLYSLVVGGRGERRGVTRMSVLYEDIARVERSRDPERVFDKFESALRLFVAEMAPRKVFVHAGAVSWRGRAIVLPGRTLAGKTTLVAELVRAGAEYYSDEFAVLDERGRVHPFPKPLAVRDGASALQTNVAVEEIGGVMGTQPLPVGLVVVSRYRAGASWRPRLLSAGRGALELLDNTVSARRQPEKALAVLEQVVTCAPVLKGTRGEAREAAQLILEMLDRRL